MLKRMLALFVVLLMSIENFAAVVGGSDGAAFVTKEEFENMKEDFNAQIDKYNNSLGNKIDGAIASYLAGLKLATDPENLYAKIKKAIGGDLVFLKEVKETKSTIKPEISISCLNRYYVKTNVTEDVDFETWRSNAGTTFDGDTKKYARRYIAKVIPNAVHYNGGHQAYNFDECADRPLLLLESQASEPHGDEGYRSYKESADDTSGGYTIVNWVFPNTGMDWTRSDADISSYNYGSSMYTNETYNPVVKVKNQNTKSIQQDGEGKVYTFQTSGGDKVLDEYSISFWPMIRGTAYFHSYGNFHATSLANFRTWHEYDNGMAITTVQTANTGIHTGWGSKSWGTEKTDESEEFGYWGTVTYALCKNTDAIDYSIMQWGQNSNNNIYAISNTANVTISTTKTTYEFEDSTYEREYYRYTDLTKMKQTNKLPKNKLEYYLPSLTPAVYKLNTFVNSYLTAVAGEKVYIGGGMPIARATDGDQTMKITFKVASSGGNTNKVKVIISDSQFTDGNVRSGASTYYSNECTPGTLYTVELTAAKNEQVVWMNLYDTNTSNNYEACLTEFDVKVKA